MTVNAGGILRGVHLTGAYPAPPARVAGTNPANRQQTAIELLREHDRKSLDRIAQYITCVKGTPDRPGLEVADQILRILDLTDRIGDAIFTTACPFLSRLSSVAEAQVALSAGNDQDFRVRVISSAECPMAVETMVLLVAQKLVELSVDCGFYARVSGQIVVTFSRFHGGFRLAVQDDGWSCAFRQCDLRQLTGLKAMVASIGGTIAITGQRGFTAALTLSGPRV